MDPAEDELSRQNDCSMNDPNDVLTKATERRIKDRERKRAKRLEESLEKRKERLLEQRLRTQKRRQGESPEQRNKRLEGLRRRRQVLKQQETQEERVQRLEFRRERQQILRFFDCGWQAAQRRMKERDRQRKKREEETLEQRKERLRIECLRQKKNRELETPEQRIQRLEQQRERQRKLREHRAQEDWCQALEYQDEIQQTSGADEGPALDQYQWSLPRSSLIEQSTNDNSSADLPVTLEMDVEEDTQADPGIEPIVEIKTETQEDSAVEPEKICHNLPAENENQFTRKISQTEATGSPSQSPVELQFLLPDKINHTGLNSNTCSVSALENGNLNMHNHYLAKGIDIVQLPHGWAPMLSLNELCLFRIQNDTVMMSLKISQQGSVNLTVLNMELKKVHPVSVMLQNISSVDHFEALLNLLERLEDWTVCTGNQDKRYMAMLQKSLISSCRVLAQTSALHSTRCLLLVLAESNESMCSQCKLIGSRYEPNPTTITS